MKKSNQNNNAITLIALIVTVIVLLILAGVTLKMVVNNEGIFEKAENTVQETEDAIILEEIKLAVTEGTMRYYSNNSEGTLNEFLAENYNNYQTESGATIKFDGNGEIQYFKGKGVTVLNINEHGNYLMTTFLESYNNPSNSYTRTLKGLNTLPIQSTNNSWLLVNFQTGSTIGQEFSNFSLSFRKWIRNDHKGFGG